MPRYRFLGVGNRILSGERLLAGSARLLRRLRSVTTTTRGVGALVTLVHIDSTITESLGTVPVHESDTKRGVGIAEHNALGLVAIPLV